MQPPVPPSSSFPTLPTPPDPGSSPKNLLTPRLLIPVVVAIVLVALITGVLYAARGTGQSPQIAQGPAPTATAVDAAAATASASGAATTTPGPTPTPTQPASTGGNPLGPAADVQVTQNQYATAPCTTDNPSYTVKLYNAGTATANWYVSMPMAAGADVVAGGPQPLAVPLSGYPYWGYVTPQQGSLAPGQTASFMVSLAWITPCGSTVYKAAVQLTFSGGGSQPDIPLTFSGTGPARYSNVVLISGSLTNIQPCPASGATAPSFSIGITNTGNYAAVPNTVVPETGPGGNYWADTQIVETPPEGLPTMLYPGQTATITVSPRAGLDCTGTVYDLEIQISNAQNTTTTMRVTDTFR